MPYKFPFDGVQKDCIKSMYLSGLTMFLMLVMAVVASGQAVSRTELRNTNNSILNSTVRNNNGRATNATLSGFTTNRGKVQFTTADTNTFQFGGNGTIFSIFDNVSGVSWFSYDHAADKLSLFSNQEVFGSVQAQIYKSSSGNQGNTVQTGGATFENGLLISGSLANVKTATNVADLVMTATNLSRVRTMGYYTNGDGGAAEYYHVSDSAPTNYGLFASVSGGRWKLLDRAIINVNQFGAKGNGIQNDRVFAQDAIWWAAQGTNGVIRVNFLSGKSYLFDYGLMIFKTNAAGAYSFVQNLTIGSDVSGYDDPSPRLTFTATNSFGFALQSGRSVTIEGLHMPGPNDTTAALFGAYDDRWLTLTNFVNPNIRTNGHSPNAAIVIDPFDADIPTGDRYAGPATNHYTATGTGGSSHCFIKDNLIRLWYIGIAHNPTVNGQQGDDINYRDNYISLVAYGVVTGQAQARSCRWKEGGMSMLYMAFDCFSIGQHIGVMPTVDGGQFTQITYFMSGSAGGWGNNSIKNIYGEQMMSLGTVGSDGASFDNIMVDFSHAPSTPTERLYVAGQVVFVNPYLTCNAPIVFRRSTAASEGSGVLFIGGIVSGGRTISGAVTVPVTPSANALNWLVFDGTAMGNGYVMRGRMTEAAYGDINGHHVQMGSLISKGTNTYLIKADPCISAILAANSPTFDTNTATGTFNSTGYEVVGDVLQSVNNINGSVGNYIGIVTAVAAGVTTYSSSPKFLGLNRHVAWNFTIQRYPRWHDATTGTWSSGSHTIGVNNPTAWSVGSTVRGIGLYEGTTVTNITGTNFGISLPTAAASTGTAIYDAIALPWSEGSGSGVTDPITNRYAGTFTNLGVLRQEGNLISHSIFPAAGNSYELGNVATGLEFYSLGAGIYGLGHVGDYMFINYPGAAVAAFANASAVPGTGHTLASNGVYYGVIQAADYKSGDGTQGGTGTAGGTTSFKDGLWVSGTVVGGSGTLNAIKENGSAVGDADIVTLDFLGADFDLTESPDTEVNIVIAAAIARDSELVTATNDAYAYSRLMTNAVVNTNVGGGLSWNGAQLSATGSGGSAIVPFIRPDVLVSNFNITVSSNIFSETGVHRLYSFTNSCNGCWVTHYVTNTDVINVGWNTNSGTNAITWVSNQRAPYDVNSTSGENGVHVVRLYFTPTNVIGWYDPPLGTANLTGKSLTVNGTANGALTLNDTINSKSFVITTTNVVQNVTNIYMTPWPAGLGWCYQVQSTNEFIVRWTNGPCRQDFTLGTQLVATNSTVNSNLSFTINGQDQIVYATNSISATNWSFNATGKGKLRVVFKPQLVNRTFISPTNGVAAFGMFWRSNYDGTVSSWGTLTAGLYYVWEVEQIESNFFGRITQW